MNKQNNYKMIMKKKNNNYNNNWINKNKKIKVKYKDS